MNTTVVKLAAAVTCIGLACPGIAIAQPSPEVPDIPEVDETFALNYAAGYDIGAAMASSCPQHIEQFEATLGEEIA